MPSKVQAIGARGGLVSFLAVLKDRFCYMPQDIVVPGILESVDLADVIAALSPRAVLLESLVDGRYLYWTYRKKEFIRI